MKQIKTIIPNGTKSNGSAATAPAVARNTAATPAPTASVASPKDYNGISYGTIVENWLALRGIAGDVAQGARNTTLYQIARDLRYICDFNVEFLTEVLPHWGLSETEARATIQSAVSSARGTEIPASVQTLLAQLKRDATEAETPLTPEQDTNPMPDKLPPIFQQVTRLYPRFAKAAVLASLPAMGTLLSRLRAKYADGEEQSPTFFTIVQAPQASGKSFARSLNELLMAPISVADEEARAEIEEYKRELKRKKNAKEQPEEPTPVIRMLPPSTSNVVLLQRTDYAKGLHVYTFSEEIDAINKQNSSGTWAQKSDLYRMAFDGAKWGQDYMSETSYSAVVRMRYNLLFLGTPLAVRKFFRKVEDGMASRFILAYLPDNRGEGLQRRKQLPKAEMQALVAKIQQAYDEGSGDNEIKLALPRTLDALDKWQMERIREFDDNPDNFALDTLRRRAAVIGFRAAMLAWWLCGKSETQEVVDFALWVTNEVLQQQMLAFGEDINAVERQNFEVLNDRRISQRLTRNLRLLDQLPDSFSREDLIAVRKKYKLEGRPDYILSRWTKKGLIQQSKDYKNCYVKIESPTQT